MADVKLDKAKLEEVRKRYSIGEAAFNLIVTKVCAAARNESEIDMFCYKCKALGLDPMLDQIHFVPRTDRKCVNNEWIDVPGEPTIQVGIDALRGKAEDSGEYCGSDAPVFHYVESQGDSTAGVPTKMNSGPVWPPGTTLVAVTATVWRAPGKNPAMRVAYQYTAYLQDYAQAKRDGSLTKMWKKVGIMLPKCAESGALRKGFPKQCSGLYTPEEMTNALSDQAEDEERAEAPSSASAAVEKKGEAPAPAHAQPSSKTSAAPSNAQSQGKEKKNEPAAKAAKPEAAPASEPQAAKTPELEAAAPPAAEEPKPPAAEQNSGGEAKKLTTQEKGTEIVKAIRDKFKDRAGSALKTYVAVCAGKEKYDEVIPVARQAAIDLLFIDLKKLGGPALAQKIADFLEKAGKKP